jgi:ParB family transcriptional regulator, chromosome partitioning protein
MAEKKANRLQRQYGDRMRDALGHGQAAPAPETAAGPDRYAGRTRGNTGEMLIENIVADPNQPRKEFNQEALERLAASLLKQGQLQPIMVSWSEALGKHVVVEGERRLRAARIAGLTKLSCVFIDEEMAADIRLEKQLTANCLREDLAPIEQANAFQRLMVRKGWTQSELAEALQLHKGQVSRALQLLDLPPTLQEQVVAGTIVPDVAREIGKITDPAQQEEVTRQVAGKGLNRAEGRAAAAKAAKKDKAKGGRPKGAGKVRTFKIPGCTVFMTFEKAPTDDVVRAALRKVLDGISENLAA